MVSCLWIRNLKNVIFPESKWQIVKLTGRLPVVPKSRMVDLYLHSFIRLYGVVLNSFCSRITSPYSGFWIGHFIYSVLSGISNKGKKAFPMNDLYEQITISFDLKVCQDNKRRILVYQFCNCTRKFRTTMSDSDISTVIYLLSHPYCESHLHTSFDTSLRIINLFSKPHAFQGVG
jgi:hypothetical protein